MLKYRPRCLNWLIYLTAVSWYEYNLEVLFHESQPVFPFMCSADSKEWLTQCYLLVIKHNVWLWLSVLGFDLLAKIINESFKLYLVGTGTYLKVGVSIPQAR